MLSENLRTKLAMLPDSPGCYLMKHQGEIIYVGKAVNLKNRVRSYFHTKEHTPKVAAMVAQVDDFDILLCNTNLEALALECNLIKLHKPHYNILLKDDKHYPYVRIDRREPFPRVTIARRMQKDGAQYLARISARRLCATRWRWCAGCFLSAPVIKSCRSKRPRARASIMKLAAVKRLARSCAARRSTRRLSTAWCPF